MRLILLVLLPLALIMSSCVTKNPVDQDVENEQEYIKSSMLQRMSIFFCTGDIYFRSCFDTNPDECVDQVEQSFDDCIPEKMPNPFEGNKAEAFSLKLGECVGRNYDYSMRKNGKYIGKKSTKCIKELQKRTK